MKKSLKVMSFLLITLLLISGCGSIPTLEDGKEAVVTLKDDNKISVDDLYTTVKDTFALEALITMIDTFILETEFEDDLEEATTYAEEYMSGMLETYGTEADLLMAIQQGSNYSTLEGYEEYIYLSYLQNHATEAYSESLITEDEIEKYYEEEAIGDIEVSHILIVPEVSSDATEDDIADAEEKAKEEIEDIIKELDDADDVEAKFEELAKEKSDDSSTKDKGGDLGQINYGTLSAEYDEIIVAAEELEDGEYSTEVITTELGYHVILKTKTHDKEPLEDIKDDIKITLAENLRVAEASSISFEALQHYRDIYEVDIVDDELKKQYNQYIDNVNASLSELTQTTE